jgi:hypothetical protein
LGKRILCHYSRSNEKDGKQNNIREQEAEDRLRDQMTSREYIDPFKRD